MNKRYFFILLVLIVCLMAAPIVSAQEDEVIYGLISVDHSDIRVGPDFAYDAVAQLPINASVIVLGRAGTYFYGWDGRQWVQIQYGSSIGWVYARLIRTSIPFNDIPVRGILLPRNRDGRVPDVFDLSTYICDGWQGSFTRSGDFMSGSSEIVVTFPALTGASVYSAIVLSPTGFRTAFDSETTTITIPLDQLPAEPGTYTWRIAPYWTTSTYRYEWQQICPLRTGGTFDKP